MNVSASKKIYSPQALTAWLDHLDTNWERYFSKEELSLARDIYRNGEIREIELNIQDAVVHAKFDKEVCYSLIEVRGTKVHVRSSNPDHLLGNSLAAAGLYEIEEFVGDQTSELPSGETPPPFPSHGSKGKASLKGELAKTQENEAPQEPKQPLSRSLLIKIETGNSGLKLTPLWQDGDKGFSPAIGEKEASKTALNSAEREKLIRLSSLARRGKLIAKDAAYLIESLGAIQEFLSRELKNWQKHFVVQLDETTQHLQGGGKSVELKVDVRRAGDAFLDFSWKLETGTGALKDAEIKRLIKQAGEPVILAGRGLFTISIEQKQLITEWEGWKKRFEGGKIPCYMLFSFFGEKPVELTLSKDILAWKDALIELDPNKAKLPKFLRPYQEQGVRWLEHLLDQNCHPLLADEMGLGKTVQLLSLLSTYTTKSKLPNVIVCPASVVPVWLQEAERFFPKLKLKVLAQDSHFKANEKSGVIWVASYAQLRRHAHRLEKTEFNCCVLDEAQLIKNPDSKISQSCCSIRAGHRIALTGTPIENRYLDIWTLFEYLMPGFLGSRKAFETRLGGLKTEGAEALRTQLAPFILRRTKQEVLQELPEKMQTDIICPLTPLQQEQYERLTKEGLAQMGEDIDAAFKENSIGFLTLLTRLRQACCDPALLPGVDAELRDSSKIGALMDKLEEIFASGHKVVIFSQFVSLLDRVKEAIKKEYQAQIPLYELTGKTKDRSAPVKAFQEETKAGAMLVSLRAGGTGITLHTADYVFLMDPWWNPAVEDQAIDRVHRLGRTDPVFVYRLVSSGTIEERMQALKKEKRVIFDKVVGEMADVSDLRNYFNSVSELISLLPGKSDASVGERE